jgi:hypothetical protein
MVAIRAERATNGLFLQLHRGTFMWEYLFNFPGLRTESALYRKPSSQDAMDLRDKAQKDKRPLTEDEIRPFGHQVFDRNTIRRECDISELRGTKVKDYLGVEVRPSRKTYIFGAGASAFCVYGNESGHYRQHPFSMPLGVELFDRKYRDVRKKYKGAELSGG